MNLQDCILLRHRAPLQEKQQFEPPRRGNDLGFAELSKNAANVAKNGQLTHRVLVAAEVELVLADGERVHTGDAFTIIEQRPLGLGWNGGVNGFTAGAQFGHFDI